MVAVEAFAWSVISDYRLGVEMARRAAVPSARILIDVCHLINTGGDLRWLESVNRRHIAAVQLNDGPRVHSDFMAKARATRRLPGDGVLEAAAVTCDGLQPQPHGRGELSELLALPLEEAAAQAARAGRRILDTVARAMS